ncbi:hypothetical protein [Profundibacterium mesophilum]|uniref:Uncharacterized protein n=1 Tax=Profundibacterium mesophilum KAUST100406-0324 TaxID=1037889 RepID=A0A921TEQ9_9RHOB|nr:hypothetical protein [Profundibacterium mesophilum]KAF0675704.1 hypothetical protein PMES_02039 [Profundibacterium mesophilum KAUST100406-0324]
MTDDGSADGAGAVEAIIADRGLGDMRAAFAARRELYEWPLLTYLQADIVRELDPGEALEPEDEINFVEAVLQATGFGMPGAVIFCRREDGGWWMVHAEWDAFAFYALPPDAGSHALVPRPDFWALRPNNDPDRGQTQPMLN